jgi:hypothetical protein
MLDKIITQSVIQNVGNLEAFTSIRFKLRSSGFWHSVGMQEDTNVSEGHPASIFTVNIKATTGPQNYIHEEIKSRLNSGNACYRSFQSFISRSHFGKHND